ncbi:MAG: TrkH family potassium uptake protein [Sediminimonas qiaohouensis]|uniref:Trk system potassium uptake protein n=1 Tax=Sediminimonas qiaohouensis TaxID=552061 RepID=A0A7C9LC04_9RHOB|nr:TrkH family potassium uptake protein [Sediminimonas qiaohouensis]MTJ05738.1 TrkH family potassium uptake protein [Sediminimonas qiaohouensis]
MNFVVFVNGLILLFMAGLMLINAVIFPATSEEFGTSALITGMVGTALTITTRSAFTGLRRLQTFLLTSSVWLTAALAGALPLYLWSMTPVDALFESMSGITTTGSTVMTGLDDTPQGILMWRAMMQMLGGVGFIVVGIALLPILKVGGMQLFRTESSDKNDKELGNAARFAFATLLVYSGLMVLCAVLYRLGGMSVFDAAAHAMTTVSTAGFSTSDASFGQFDSAFLQWTAVFFMIMGALPFAWYIRVLYRGRLRSEQVLALLWTLAAFIACVSLWLALTTGTPPLDALRLAAFNVVSILTTTGYSTADYTLWGPFAVAVFFLLTAAGGCTGSTSGGVKAMRWIILLRAARAEIRKIPLPNAVSTIRYEGRKVEDDVMAGVISFFTFFALTFGCLAFALGLLGLDFQTALSGALTAVANVGPGIGPVIGPAGSFAPLGDAAKLLIVAGMFLGRLEMLTVLVLFSPAFWREA